jgi:hypothetical protein
MQRKRAIGGGIIKSYRFPGRRERQMLIKAGREAGVMVDVEGESQFYNNITMILDGHTNLEHNLPVANYYDDLVQFFALAKAHNTPTLVVTFGELFGENYLYQTTEAWKDPKVKTYVQEALTGYSPLRSPYGAPPYVRAMTTVQAAEEIWDIGFRAVSRSTKKLDDAGVTINVGSHGEVPGLAMHWEPDGHPARGDDQWRTHARRRCGDRLARAWQARRPDRARCRSARRHRQHQ